MRFKVYGPYDIGVDKGHSNWIDKEDTDSLWEKIRRNGVKDEYDLPDACGVYLFGMNGEEGRKGKAGKTLPWYVGKAEKLKFKTECFNFKNLYDFNSVLTNEYRGRGTPILFLLARVGKDDKPSPPAKDEQYRGVRFVEEMFIQMALSANRDLLNKSTTKMARETSIRGFLNMTKKESARVREFKGVFGMKDRKPIDIVKYEDTKFRYEVYGPYDVPMKNPNKVKERIVGTEQVEEFWSTLGKEQNLLSTACGVYVVGMRNKGNTTPWYVGTAHHRSFEEICFKSDIEKLQLQKVINNKKGAPVIYFLPRWTKKKGDFEPAKPMKNKPADMDYVKRVLLEYGVRANDEILFEDSPETEILRELYVEGFVKSEPGDKKKNVVLKLKQLLGQ